jgi:RNA polymerase sigma-70 factor (ECF subfamily)
MPFKFRVVFVLAEIEGLAHAEIADIEKIRPGTVKSRLSRAKAALRKAIGEMG